ncbi:MAG: Lrp/AsnC ligand binding domain-containing protein [Bacteroidales bacterium]|nr:Lrp/AsnC ligand binding domain-containing protein [Bacteroidales bacterium]
MPKFELDDIDRKILFELAQDARRPYMDIARSCGISGAAIHKRVAKLEESGVITGSRVSVKPSAIGLGVCVFISISLSEAGKYKDVIEKLKTIPEIVECHFVTGKYALLLKAFCRDNDHLINILIKTIQNIPYIQSTETMISLDSAFERQVWVKSFDPR